ARKYNTAKKEPMSSLVIIQDEQRQRFEAKLRRELGDTVLGLLADSRTEDILLNPDAVLWTKRMGEGFVAVGQIPPAQAVSAYFGAIRGRRRERADADPACATLS
uniref:hypothetical protein n=1 Tax=Mycobacterium sp. TaxID=1785 RepID=UPI003F9C74FF